MWMSGPLRLYESYARSRVCRVSHATCTTIRPRTIITPGESIARRHSAHRAAGRHRGGGGAVSRLVKAVALAIRLRDAVMSACDVSQALRDAAIA